jgi:phage FluMu protein Com
MDITAIELGEKIPNLKCPRCKQVGNIVLRGLYRKEENSHELECDCFFTTRVNPKDFKLTYESKAEKEERLEKEKAEKEERKGRRR